MKVKCKADYYVCEYHDGDYVVYNELYENQSLASLVLMAITEVFIPGVNGFGKPQAIYIHQPEGMVVVEEDLSVTGSTDYEYFVLDRHLAKWRKSYGLVGRLFLVLGLLLEALLFYLFVFESSYDLCTGLFFLAMLGLFISFLASYGRHWGIEKRRKAHN